VQLFQSLGATLGFSIFGSLLSRHIHDGIAGLSDQFPADSADSIMNGGLPAGLSSDLVLKIKTVFADAFQEMFLIGAVFAAAAFVICWFMKREVLSQKQETEQSTAIQA
jgi:hypothetical protein